MVFMLASSTDRAYSRQITSRAKILPNSFIFGNKQFRFSIDDEIFSVTQPAKRLQNEECAVCLQIIKEKKNQTYCAYCGKNVHNDVECSRKRSFFLLHSQLAPSQLEIADKAAADILQPGDKIDSTIDLICLKKFHIDKMIQYEGRLKDAIHRKNIINLKTVEKLEIMQDDQDVSATADEREKTKTDYGVARDAVVQSKNQLTELQVALQEVNDETENVKVNIVNLFEKS